ncbi:MAG TPA: DUF885 domain-containing protein [Acidimicrobiia bacterium]|nr:DUF885 domain-containing protein [Acidimicrobiia bacterium]
MRTPFEISDSFTEQWADADPISATTHGISGRDELSTDYSPDGYARRADLYRATRNELSPFLGDPDPRDSFAARVQVGWLDEEIAKYEAGEWQRDLNHSYSPLQVMRDVFDVMARETGEDWETIRTRLQGLPGMLDGYRQSLQAGIDADRTVARRQVESAAEQADAAASPESRFLAFPKAAAVAGGEAQSISNAVESVRAAYADFAGWLRDIYLPTARPEDPVGREDYERGVDEFLGMTLDLEATYDWAWDEVHRIRSEMESTSSEIDPDLSTLEVIQLLESDPDRAAATRQDFVDFVSAIQDQAISQLAGKHFDVPDELKVVTVNIAPPGGALGAWYVGPSEDLSRPGSIWYAPGERQALPYWQEVSTAYHEGFPGHHLQVATAVIKRDELARFHRMAIWYSGAGEGWALYAERLMDELGFFEKPEYRFGLQASQLMRATRVIVDIGCQLSLSIPEHAPLHAGDPWSYERAVDYMHQIALQAPDVAESEVKRYLGWVAQAISYKVGEREILAMRDRARAKPGFDVKDFHRRMLEAGAIRLDQLWEHME